MGSPGTHKFQLEARITAFRLAPCGTRYNSKLEAASEMKDRRTSRRYELSLPLNVRASEDAAFKTGKTRDISNRGLYFTIDIDLDSGADLFLNVTLPAEVTTGNSDVVIRTTGKVIRVDKPNGIGNQKVGIAAMFNTYEIVRSKSDLD